MTGGRGGSVALHLHGTGTSSPERSDPFRSFAVRRQRPGAELRWFDGGHLSGVVAAVAEDVKALTVRS